MAAEAADAVDGKAGPADHASGLGGAHGTLRMFISVTIYALQWVMGHERPEAERPVGPRGQEAGAGPGGAAVRRGVAAVALEPRELSWCRPARVRCWDRFWRRGEQANVPGEGRERGG